ncbi:hypothetical protein ACLQ16_03830 [Streptomyces albidoflavus]|uniref:hypothetical protein n=1 Tax=Streptomyces albidoflavus TaxID=1886 RepID=UPI000A1CC8A4|nr:hypothetical protein [Streptomyces albidoflavus]
MNLTITPLAPAARAAYGAYATLRRRALADELTDRLRAMHEYASKRANTPIWEQAVQHLDHATRAIASVETAPRKDRKALRQVAVTVTMSAILAFERAHDVTLPYDEHGRYNPAPGTEYPFSVSDIGRAAVQLLGPDWHAESTPWGVGAGIEHTDESVCYLLAVDESGDLYVADDGHGGRRTDVEDAVASDGLDLLARRVADLVLSLHTAED